MKSDTTKPPDFALIAHGLREENAALAARVKRLEEALRDAHARLYTNIEIEPRTIQEVRARIRTALGEASPNEGAGPLTPDHPAKTLRPVVVRRVVRRTRGSRSRRT